jgi:hypothetical protein
MNTLKAQIQASIAAQIAEAFADEDEETIAQAIRDGSTYEEAISQIVDQIEEWEGMQSCLSASLKLRQERKRRYADKCEKARALLIDLLNTAGTRKAEIPSATISLKHAPKKLIVTDEDALPDDLCRITRKPDARLIKEALEAGLPIPGAQLSNGGETIAIRKS